jgi:hypothetical protein
MQIGLTIRLPRPHTSDIIFIQDAALGKPRGLQEPTAFSLKSVKTTSHLLTVSAELNWEASKHARCYNVTVAETPELTPAIAYEVSTTPSILLPNLPGSRTFYWRVDALSRGGSRINDQPSGTFTTPAILSRDVAFASDMQWTKATVGADNPVRRDKNLNGQTLKINGQPFGKGLWTHPFNDTTPADIVFDVRGKKFAVFKASVGLDDLGTQGSVQFQVLADGQKKAESPIMLPRNVHDLAVDVTGARESTLRVLNGGDGYSYDHAVWGLARFMEAGIKDPFESAKPQDRPRGL